MSTRPSFLILEDLTTKVATPVHQAFDGDTATARNAHGVLPCLDSSGNLRYIRQNDSGQIHVTLEGADQASLFDDGSVSGTTSYQDIAVITLGNSYEYSKPEFHASCFRDAVVQVLFIDNGVETKLPTLRLGSGVVNDGHTLETVKWTSGATGVQKMVLRGKLLQALPATAIDGFVAVQEKQ